MTSMMARFPGTWSATVTDLSTGESFSINSHRAVAASLIKLYVLESVYQAFADGTLAQSASTQSLLSRMITVSDNAATNSLVELLGSGSFERGEALVNATISRSGYSSTRLQRRLGITGYSTSNDNYTSTADCALLLSRIHNGSLVSSAASASMLKLLLAQTRRTKIPAGVPSSVRVANKTGENTGIENDSAIVYGGASGGHDYALAVMSSGVSSTTAQAEIRSLSAAVYASIGK
jgi:beta-lactamase class A